jgi:hypothetical protein
MGELINLNPVKPIADADLPPSITRDTEFAAADAAHVNAQDPHPLYLTQAEASLLYRLLANTQTFTSTVKSVGISSGTISTSDANTQANKSGHEVQAANASSAAYISLHRPGIWGVHFGLDINNQLCVGGWSLGNFSYKIFHEGTPPLIKAPLPSAAIAGNSFVISWNSVQPGLGIAELCNYSGNGGGPAAFDFFRLPGNPDSTPTISNRVASVSVTGAYSQTSDKRVKSDFTNAPGLEVVMALKPLKYKHWNCIGFDKKYRKLELGETFTEKVGFLAQDVRSILPEAVSKPQSEGELYALDYNCVLTVAVQAIKEQQRQIEELQEQVRSLQAFFN